MAIRYTKKQLNEAISYWTKMLESKLDDLSWDERMEIGARIEKDVEFGLAHDLDMTDEFLSRSDLVDKVPSVPLLKRVKYFAHLLSQHINPSWLGEDGIDVFDEDAELGTVVCIQLKKSLFENGSFANNKLQILQKIVFNDLVESEAYVEFLDSDQFSIKYVVPDPECPVVYVNVTFSEDEYLLK